MNTNSATGAPQEKFAYIAKSCKNIFSKGKFTQELVGSLLPLTNNSNNAGRPSATSVDSGSRERVISGTEDFIPGVTDAPPSSVSGETDAGNFEIDNLEYAGAVPTPQPSSVPEDPTSNGDIFSLENNRAPPNASTADDALISQTAAEEAYYRAGSPQSGPIYDAYNAALDVTDQAQTQLENANYNTPGFNYKPAPLIVDPNTGRILGSVPQLIARDD